MWGESFFLNYSFLFGAAIQFLSRVSKKEMREGGHHSVRERPSFLHRGHMRLLN